MTPEKEKNTTLSTVATPETAGPNSGTALTEEKTLQFWKDNNIFEKTLAKKSPKGEFIFYEGPPTANAAPAIHHLEARAFKDIIPRFKTMQGFHVTRKGGWDTHGLPVELQVEKKLGLKSKKEIETYGIEAFNKKCKENVWEQIDIWEKFTDRIGYWVDQENPYITYEKTYMESVWNILKNISTEKVGGKDLIYKDYKVVPWCPRCGTGLSSHELAQDGAYQDVKDLSVTPEFRLKSKADSGSNVPTSFLAWTTTPWTLPGNVALAVNPNISYVEIEKKDMGTGASVRFILAKERLETVFGKDEYTIVREVKGEELVGLEYEPLYPYLSEKFKNKDPEAFAKAYKVYAADFVTTTDGTGIVHTAVMYGQEDFELGTKIGLPKFHLVSEDGHFLSGMGNLSGRFVKSEETDIEIIKDLAHRDLLFKKEKYSHSYPHCWRCKTPLIYYARDSWYIRMSALREKLVKENEKINWEPSHIRDGRFGEWLREAKDWAISRERYWGTPLPIWETAGDVNDANDVGGASVREKVFVGSVSDLKTLLPKRNNYFLVRHGQSETNAKGGTISSDIKASDPLTSLGEKQIKKAAKSLRKNKIDLIISSPFSRAKQTAEMIAKEIGYAGEIIENPKIGEMRVENWHGKSWEEYQAQFSNMRDRFRKDIGPAENYEGARARVAAFMYEIDSKHQGKNILIVGHGAPLTLIDLSSKGYSVLEMADHYYENDFENGEVREIDWRNLPHNEKFEVDLHRPYIDAVELFDKNGRSLKRVKEVLDVWFDSGAMPFAQNHFPFEANAKKLPYPADYISEAIDQTRGWFYTLHAIGVLMGNGKAYKNVICLGHILDAEGKKMSKSLGNVVNPWVMMDKYGVDALRMWMYSVNQPGDSKNFDERSVDDIVKKVFNLSTNIAALYELYADKNVEASDRSSHVLDRWIIARLNQLVSEGTEFLNNFKVFEPARATRDFLADFSTWYIRRSRDRFKSENLKERNEALSTTRFVLLELSKYMAPFTPFYADFLFAKVKSEKDPESVHLAAWPKAGRVDEKILADMAELRRVVSLALELRAKAGLKIRQPLAALHIKDSKLKNKKELLGLISDEINIKEVVFDEKRAEEIFLDTKITPALEEEGNLRELIRAIQDLRKQEKLHQSDQVSLKVVANSKTVELVKRYENEIKKSTNLNKIESELSGPDEKFEINKIQFKISKS